MSWDGNAFCGAVAAKEYEELREMDRESLPPRLMVYGPEGVGKSSFAALAPSPVFVQTEDGLSERDASKFPLCTTFDDLVLQLKAVRDEDHAFGTLVIDSLDGAERLIWDRVCNDYGVKSIEKADGGYGKGYVHALTYWCQLLSLWNEIRARRQMAVILIAHAAVERVEDPEHAAYDRYTPRIHKTACSLVCEQADAVLFASRRNGGERILRTNGSPAFIAKNRYGLPMELPLSFSAFVEALKMAPEEQHGEPYKLHRARLDEEEGRA